MSAHTPGPWALNGVMALDTPLWIVSIPGEQARIEVADYSAESEGNARLIAAAPELLAALAGIIEIGKRDMTNPKYDAYFEEARAAIKKAVGS